MRKSIVVLALPFVLVVACGRNRMDREQTEYQVVQEGAATGVTSTIGGTPPPLTGTNADTTTAFTLDPRLSTAPPLQEPGTIAGTMPAQPSYGSSQPAPATRPATPSTEPGEPSYTPAPAPVRPATPAPRPPSTTRPSDPPPTTTRPSDPPTDTVEPPPPADTAPPTETAPPTTTRPRRDPVPPPTDTAPPPPPTTTDTEGGSGVTEGSDGR